MEPEEYLGLLRRGWVLLLILAVSGAAGGAFTARSRPASYRSTAVTTITTSDTGMTAERAYSVTQSIRVTMPAYLAYARGEEVIAPAAAAVGISPAEAEARMTVSRDPDSTVLSWSAVASTPDTQAMLNAATQSFTAVITRISPKTENGKPLIRAVINRTASPPLASGVSQGIGMAAGAFFGLLVGLVTLILLTRWDQRIRRRDSMELGLAMPVLAELVMDAEARASSWRYVAAFLAREQAESSILIVGGAKDPSELDGRVLEDQLRALTHRDASVQLTTFSDPALAARSSSASGVVFLLVQGVDSVASLRSVTSSIRHVCPGPVIGVLDHARRGWRASRSGKRRKGGIPPNPSDGSN